jgi:hypothetical protein
MIRVQVSVGEAIDKWNILHIKKDNITNQTRLAHVQHEIDCLKPDIEQFLNIPQINRLYAYLDFFNRKIWDLCDKVRVADINRFETGADEEYSTSCKDIIKLNDARFRVKNKINDWSFSNLKEQKNFKGNCLCIRLSSLDLPWITPVVVYLSMCYDQIVLDFVSTNCDDLDDIFKHEKNIHVGKFDENCVHLTTFDTMDEKIKHLEKMFNFSYKEICTICTNINKN